MIGAIEWNLNHGQREMRLCEIGKSYEVRDGKPVESPIVTLGATGFARRKSIHESGREFAFADLKGDLDQLFELAGGSRWTLGGPAWLASGQGTQISAASEHGKLIAVAGQLSQKLAQRLKFRHDVFLAEIRLEPLLEAIARARASLRYEPLPRFPAVERDFSLTLNEGITFAQVADEIRSLKIAELRRIEATDLFRGGQIPSGRYSLLVRVTFQSAESTFTEAQLADFSVRIVGALEKKLGAALRAN